MNAPDRYRDLLEYLSFLGARFDIDVPSHHRWPFRFKAHDSEEEHRAHATEVVSLVVRTLPDDAYVLVVVPAGKVPTNRELQSALGSFQWIGPDETLTVSAGVTPETLPPFGWPYLPGIANVVLDPEIAAADVVAFKAAASDHRLFMTSRDFQNALGKFDLFGPSAPLA